MRCAMWYHLYNLKNVKNTHAGVLLLVKPATLLKVTLFQGCFDKNINNLWVSDRSLILLSVPNFVTNFMRVSYFYFLFFSGRGWGINGSSTNPTKWSNTLKQFVGNLPTNCLNVFDHFMKLTLKGLIPQSIVRYFFWLRLGDWRGWILVAMEDLGWFVERPSLLVKRLGSWKEII